MSTQRKTLLVKRFQNLLRSGEDLTVEYMCGQAANKLFYTTGTAMKIINAYYNSIITDPMREFVKNSNCSRKEEIRKFCEEFNLCDREAILIIRYIRRNG